MKIYAFDTGKQKTIFTGDLHGDTFTRHVEHRHFMRVVGGYGIQEDAFQRIVSDGVKRIEMITPTGTTYSSPIGNWVEHGLVADYGNGKQRFLSLKYMSMKEVKSDGK